MSDLEELASKECEACGGGMPPLTGAPLAELHAQLGSSWQLVDEHNLFKSFIFKDFVEALEFVNTVGSLAEEMNHHPDIGLSWGKVDITLFTHKINGLSEADFVLAAQIETAYQHAL